jgi:hypothetical protein
MVDSEVLFLHNLHRRLENGKNKNNLGYDPGDAPKLFINKNFEINYYDLIDKSWKIDG